MTPRTRTIGGALVLLVAGTLVPGCDPAKSELSAAGREAPGAAEPDRTPMTDEEIERAVEEQLRLDPGVPSYRLAVEVEEGVITLAGAVGNLLARDRAGRLAGTVRGGRSVINRIEVQVEDIPDGVLETMVRQALVDDPVADLAELEVAAEHGDVILRGTTDSWREKQLAERVVRSVAGVRSVDDRVTAAFRTDRPDDELLAEIRGLIDHDVLVPGSLVDVAVEDGAVTIRGAVGSVAQRRRIESRAWVAGVRSLDTSELRVADWLEDETLRERDFVPRDDEEVERAVSDALRQDPRVRRFGLEIDARTGVVTLRGTVDSLKARRAAERTARDTQGVWSVRNHLHVAPEEDPADEALQRRVRDALRRDAYVERHQIEVEADHGVVTLTGIVDTVFERAQADDVASRVVGVVHVLNRLDVEDDAGVTTYDPLVDDAWMLDRYEWYAPPRPGLATRTDWEIERRVREELRWNPALSDDPIVTTVEDGEATLVGTVDSWAERLAASTEAYEGGATAVDNDLRVRFGPPAQHP